jgi:2-isopropylmalate synthase
VFTAFSGSNQDAIKKGFAAQEARNDEFWEVPYLPIDPKDLGRDYEAVIRVNSQSGKGGVAWVIEQDKGLKLPKRLQAAFSSHVQRLADETSRELNAEDIWQLFEATYLPSANDRFALVDYDETGSTGQRVFAGRIAIDGEERSVSGRGNGLISGVIAALREACGIELDVIDYNEHAIGRGSEVAAAAYLECRAGDGRTVFGVGTDTDIATASVRAVLSAANAV